MKIVVYCQHVLGIGHLFRSLEICRALSNFNVMLVTGGPQVDADLPGHVRQICLPDLQMNKEFKGLYSSKKHATLDQIKAERQQQLFTLFETEKPDVFLIELYPFGRKAFRFELDPVLDALSAKKLPRCKVVCSVRDILVEKDDHLKHELRAVETLNRYFDAVLVHADPLLATISETFELYDKIKIPVIYTGYIARKPEPNAGKTLRRRLQIGPDEFLIIASAGGGNVGAPLLGAAIRAFAAVQTKRRGHLKVFTGPFLDSAEFVGLKNMAGKNIQVEQFTADFLSFMAAADLSISMAGYNTTMNILATTVPALVWPFPQNREQRLRSARLAALGVLKILENGDLRPDRLATIMAQILSSQDRVCANINLEGAVNTAKWIEDHAF